MTKPTIWSVYYAQKKKGQGINNEMAEREAQGFVNSVRMSTERRLGDIF